MARPPVSKSDVSPKGVLSRDGAVRLVDRGARWQVMVHQPDGWVVRGELEGPAVESLKRKGRLNRRPDGTWDLVRAAALPARLPPQAGERPGFNDAESPLSWLRTRKDKSGRPLISDQQYIAGERLRADFERAMLAQRVTASWDVTSAARRGGGHGPSDPGDGALAARQRFHRAMDAVGPELASILHQVCCLAAGLEQAERLLDLPQRSGKAVLGLALTALVRHYGLAGHTQARRPGHWGLPGYRPAIPELEDA